MNSPAGMKTMSCTLGSVLTAAGGEGTEDSGICFSGLGKDEDLSLLQPVNKTKTITIKRKIKRDVFIADMGVRSYLGDGGT